MPASSEGNIVSRCHGEPSHEKQLGWPDVSRGLRGWGDLEAEGGRAAPEGIDAALTLLFFVMLLALVDEGLATCQHEIHHARELVGHCGVGAWLVHPGTQPAVKSAQRRVAMGKGHGRHLERLPRPVGRAFRA